MRDGAVVVETSIAQLKRFKDDVREVQEGFECGILLEGFNDVKEGDVLEVYEVREVERTDLSEASARAGLTRRPRAAARRRDRSAPRSSSRRARTCPRPGILAGALSREAQLPGVAYARIDGRHRLK